MENQKVTTLRNSHLFKGLDLTDEFFESIDSLLIPVKEGEILYKETELSEFVYVIVDGSVKILGKELINNNKSIMIEKDEFFGHSEILFDSIRKTAAVALQNSYLLGIHRDELFRLIESNKNLLAILYKNIHIESKEHDFKQDISPVDDIVFSENIPAEEKLDKTSLKIQQFLDKYEQLAPESEDSLESKELIDEVIPVDDEKSGSFPIDEIKKYHLEPKIEVENLRFEGLNAEQLAKINKAAQLVNSNIRIDDVLSTIIKAACELTEAERGTVYIVDRKQEEIWSKFALDSEVKEIKLKIGVGIAGTVAKTGETINLPDVQYDKRFNSFYDKWSGYKTKTMLCMPIKNKSDEIVGVLQLLNTSHERFNEIDREILNAFSIHSALAIENAAMLEKLIENERINSLGKMTNFLIQDIKKPLLVSKKYAEHVKSKNLPPEAVKIVDMLIEQISQVVEIVVSTSNYTEGNIILRSSITKLNPLLSEYAERVKNMLDHGNIKLHEEYGADLKVKIDTKEFFQVYNQLIKNAIESMPNGGKIFIQTKKSENFAEIHIVDFGCGIPDSIKEKIFDPFISYGKTHTTGLGLSIARKIIQEHEGIISVENNGETGTKFIIRIPIAE